MRDTLLFLLIGWLSGLPILAAQTPTAGRGARPAASIPAESAGWDHVVEALLLALDAVDVLALGEAHGRRVDADLRLRLVRHPGFSNNVHFIVTELGDPQFQAVLDRYLDGADVPRDDLQAALGTGDYAELVDAVREVNRLLPAGRRIRMFSTNLPDGDRNALAVSILREQLLQRGGKALVIFGAGHLWHGEGGITRLLQQTIPGRIFVAETLAGFPNARTGAELQELDRALRSLDRTVKSAARPVLLSMRDAPAAQLLAHPFYLDQAMLPPGTTLGDLDDAVVYAGTAADIDAPPGRDEAVEQLPQIGPTLIAVHYEGTSRLDMAEINERLGRNGIRIRLDAPVDGLTTCVIKEILGDLMAEKGFGNAGVAQRPAFERSPGGARLVRITFTIREGRRSDGNASSSRGGPSPRARCER